jgi:hypothetical protein
MKYFCLILICCNFLMIGKCQKLPCPYYPAPCPEEDYIHKYSDVNTLLSNGIIQQEIAFDKDKKILTFNTVNKIAKENNWEFFELDEFSYNFNYVKPSFAYDIRPPHMYSISFLFIVNKDEIENWRSYQTSYNESYGNIMGGMIDTTEQKKNKFAGTHIEDSLQFYIEKAGKYATDHYEQYSKDLLSDNKKGIKTYENGTENINKKLDYYKALADKEINNENQDNDTKINSVEQENNIKTAYFRDKSVALIKFEFNYDFTFSGISNQEFGNWLLSNKKVDVKSVQYASVANSKIVEYHASSIYQGQFHYPNHEALLLVDGWNIKSADKGYEAYGSLYKESNIYKDHNSIKRIKCDQLQTVALNIQGSPESIKKITIILDMTDIKKAVVR